MDQHDEHEEGGAHGVHLPDPSIWPLVAGFAALLLGFALVWWVRDDDSELAGPFLGAAAVAAIISIAGWSYQDGVMKRKAEEGDHGPGPREARFTQVVTFAIVEGGLDAARAPGGVLADIEDAVDRLRDLSGFQDLRVTVSPAAAGPAQVLVETTWAGREDLASYNESRQSLLDVIAAHPDDVVTGSSQAFDMEVLRDTKDTTFRFSWASASIMLAAVALGGLTLALGLSVFQDDSVEAGDDGGGPVGFQGTIVASNSLFDLTEGTLPPGAVVTMIFDNQDDGVAHNIALYNTTPDDEFLQGCVSGCDPEEGGGVVTEIAVGPIVQTFTFTTPGVGAYAYNCQVHPDTMQGTLNIVEGAPIPGEAPPPPAEGEGTPPAEETPEA